LKFSPHSLLKNHFSIFHYFNISFRKTKKLNLEKFEKITNKFTMPAMEVETVVSHKKSKKSKKMKKEVVEEEQEEEVEATVVEEDDEAANGLKKELKQIIEEGVTEEDEDLMVR